MKPSQFTDDAREVEAKAREIYDQCGIEFNINSPKQLGDILFNKLNLPKPMKYGKGKTISTAVDVLEDLAENHKDKFVIFWKEFGRVFKEGVEVTCGASALRAAASGNASPGTWPSPTSAGAGAASDRARLL